MSPSFGATFENIFYGFQSKCSRSFFITAKEKMTAFEKNFSNLPLCHVAYRLSISYTVTLLKTLESGFSTAVTAF